MIFISSYLLASLKCFSNARGLTFVNHKQRCKTHLIWCNVSWIMSKIKAQIINTRHVIRVPGHLVSGKLRRELKTLNGQARGNKFLNEPSFAPTNMNGCRLMKKSKSPRRLNQLMTFWILAITGAHVLKIYTLITNQQTLSSWLNSWTTTYSTSSRSWLTNS